MRFYRCLSYILSYTGLAYFAVCAVVIKKLQNKSSKGIFVIIITKCFKELDTIDETKKKVFRIIVNDISYSVAIFLQLNVI